MTNGERWDQGPRRGVPTSRRSAPYPRKPRSLQRFQWASVMVPANEPEETPWRYSTAVRR